MSSWGVTQSGFVLKTYDDILNEANSKARELFGTDIELSEYGAVGLFNQLMSKSLSDTWEDFEDMYHSMFVNTAEGVSLDRVVALGGVTRRAATKALVNISISGTSVEVPLGFLMQTASNIQFETIGSGTAVPSGTAITSRAIVAGETGVVPAGAINEIVNPVSGITGVNNYAASSGGLPIETDYELRQRYEDRTESGGSSVPAILNALYETEGVITAHVYENDTDVTDGDGLPPHSIYCVVSGSALDIDIATSIFNSKAAGIATYGSQSAYVLDENGDSHLIKWGVATTKYINVIVNITSNAEWVAGNETAVKTAVVKAIGGVDTVEGIATEYEGLGVGVDVRVWQIIAQFDGITGIESTPVIYIAFAPTTPTSGNKLTIGANEVARCDEPGYITVNVS
jgi:uncharacterized phage protein gp47/JayE